VKGAGPAFSSAAPLVGFPWLAPVGVALEKIPWDEAVAAVLRRFQRATQGVSDTTTEVSAALSQEGREVLAPTPQAGTQAEMGDTDAASQVLMLIRQHPEPFQAALEQAIETLPMAFAQFFDATHPLLELGHANGESSIGLWPAFTLELVARRHFRSQLGHSIAVAESAEARALVEGGLALDAIETLGDALLAKRAEDVDEQGAAFLFAEGAGRAGGMVSRAGGSSTRLLHFGQPYRHGLPGLSSGYVIGYRWAGPGPSRTPAHAMEWQRNLLAKLGRMSAEEVEALTVGWVTAVLAAFPLSGGTARRKMPRGLSRLHLPTIFLALRGAIEHGLPAERREDFRTALIELEQAIEDLVRLTSPLKTIASERFLAAAGEASGKVFQKLATDLLGWEKIVVKLQPERGPPALARVRNALASVTQIRGWAV
jgi:hypothetical protein